MIEFILEMLQDMFQDGWFGITIAVILIGCAATLVGFVVYGLFIAIDSWFLPRQQASGRVVSKEFTPAHTTQIPVYNATTKTTNLVPVFHPDDWRVTVEIPQGTDDMSVSSEFYEGIRQGAQVRVSFVTGRLSSGVYLKELTSC